MSNERQIKEAITPSWVGQGICQAMKTSPLAISYQKVVNFLDNNTNLLPPFVLRIILAYEFWEAGMMKVGGENWFDQLSFPFPFSLLSNDVLWAMSTWFEVLGAIALLLGLATRFFSLALMILTVVAIYTVHWPSEWHTLTELSKGYTITDEGYGNFKLPVVYLIMFMPLLFGGAGRLSLDYVIYRFFTKSN